MTLVCICSAVSLRCPFTSGTIRRQQQDIEIWQDCEVCSRCRDQFNCRPGWGKVQPEAPGLACEARCPIEGLWITRGTYYYVSRVRTLLCRKYGGTCLKCVQTGTKGSCFLVIDGQVSWMSTLNMKKRLMERRNCEMGGKAALARALAVRTGSGSDCCGHLRLPPVVEPAGHFASWKS